MRYTLIIVCTILYLYLTAYIVDNITYCQQVYDNIKQNKCILRHGYKHTIGQQIQQFNGVPIIQYTHDNKTYMCIIRNQPIANNTNAQIELYVQLKDLSKCETCESAANNIPNEINNPNNIWWFVIEYRTLYISVILCGLFTITIIFALVFGIMYPHVPKNELDDTINTMLYNCVLIVTTEAAIYNAIKRRFITLHPIAKQDDYHVV